MAFDRDGALKRAEKALRQGRIDAAVAEYLHVTEAEPRDWTSAQALGDLYVRAGQVDRALAQYARTADQLIVEGMVAEALALFQKSLKLKPGDEYATTRVRQVSHEIGLTTGRDLPFFAPEGQGRGHRSSPGEFLRTGGSFAPSEPRESTEVEDLLESEDDRSPWFTMAEIALREGRLEEGRVAVAEALQFDPSSKETALVMAYRVAPTSPDAAYQVIDVIVDRCIDDNEYAAAASALQEFVTRVRFHLVALMRLVEVAMEGGLEATMYEAQAQLTDAYLDAGRGLEARVISEDLVAREPWNRANIERFRKALALLGEPDPDAIIAGRLSGESPFLATDLIDFNRQDEGDDGLEAFDGEEAPGRDEPLVLTTPLPGPSATPLTGEERAIAQFRLGVAFRDLGLLDDAVRALEAATTSENLRFKAASLLGVLHRQRGHSAPAVEWLDRAARWAPPATDIGRAVRYDLGGALEDVGDHDRALAVYTGLESEQVGYRDVSDRIQRLLESKPQG
jgi:tetratricopeptide (TPR) repeat protein